MQPVTEPAHTVHHDERQVFGEAAMLVAVVHHQHGRAAGNGRLGRAVALGCDPHREMAGMEQRFVAHVRDLVAVGAEVNFDRFGQIFRPP